MCEHTRLSQFCNNGVYDFSPIFADVIPILKKSDFVVANLETPLAGISLTYSERNFSFNTPDEMAEALRECGVGLVTTANNHVLDRGVAGLERTLDVLDANGISHTGSYRQNEEPLPFIINIGGIKVAFLSYTYGTEACYNKNYLKKSQINMVNLTRNQELSNPVKRFFLVHKALPAKVFRLLYRFFSPKRAKIEVSERKEKDRYQKKHLLSDINYCKEKAADYIVMCLHSGGQFNDVPTEYTKNMAELCLCNGVNAVVINHEHRIQNMQFFDNRIVTYCLGNFTSNYGIIRNPKDKHAEYSALFHLYLDKKSALKTRCSVTFLKSHMIKNGTIITTPINQLYCICEDETQKEALKRDNLWCLNTFFGTSLVEVDMREEYFADEFVCKCN